MTQKRAPGGGRKPLTQAEPTVKVAITLLESQVEAMKQLGNGNLSLGIRKAIETMPVRTRREQIIGKIANLILYHHLDAEAADDQNKKGWTFDIRFVDAEYINENEWNRVENVRLDPDELTKAVQIAAELEATL